MISEDIAGNKGYSIEQEESHLGHPQDIPDVGDCGIIRVELAVFYDKITHPVDVVGIVLPADMHFRGSVAEK